MYLNCDLTTGVCPRCGRAGQPHWLRNCRVGGDVSGRCVHRSDEVTRAIECQPCYEKTGRKTKLKVFACPLRGECSERFYLQNTPIKNYFNCADYRPAGGTDAAGA